MHNIRVLLADEFAMVREGLKLLICAQPNLHIVGVAATDAEVRVLAQTIQTDIVLLSISRAKRNMYQLIEYLTMNHPETKILIISGFSDDGILYRMRCLGVTGYIDRHGSFTQFSDAILQVVQGKRIFISASESMENTDFPNRIESCNQLTKTEERILRLTAQGYSNKDIARFLNYNFKTIEGYKNAINRKLGFKKRSDLVAYALNKGWVLD